MATTKKSPAATAKKPQRPTIRSSHEPLLKKPARPAAKKAKEAPPRPVRPRVDGKPTKKASGPASKAGAATSVRAPRSRRPKALAADAHASDKARELALWIATAAWEKKALGLEILDVSGRVDYTDFLVLMTGRADRQVVALAQAIEESVSKHGQEPLAVEGLSVARWVLMDYGDVVVHIFQEEARSLYDIDGLWVDARRVPLPSD